MSTRCTIHFHYGEDPDARAEAIVYRHSDGYPESVLPDLERFFTDVESQTTDTRFNDPNYLAAKFVVWEAGESYNYRPSSPLNFLSVGITMEDPGDIEYRYHVWCGTNIMPSGNTRPKVTWEDA